MHKTTFNDWWKSACMRRLLQVRACCKRSRLNTLKSIAYLAHLEIQDLDRRYFKPRLEQLCKQASILRLGSGSSGRRLYFHTFQLITHEDNFERITGSGFPDEYLHLLGGGPTVTLEELLGPSAGRPNS